MRYMLIVLSALGLCLTVVPSLLVFYGLLSWKIHTQLMFAGMILWFVTAPMWMNKETQ